MNHAKNGTIKTGIKNSIFELIFIGFHALYPPSLHSNRQGLVNKAAPTSEDKFGVYLISAPEVNIRPRVVILQSRSGCFAVEKMSPGTH